MVKVTKSKKLLVTIGVIVLVLVLVGLLAFALPATSIGQKYLQAKAKDTFDVTFSELTKNFDGLSKQKPDIKNSYCSELQMRELDPGEKGWIKECSALRIFSYNVKRSPGLSSALKTTEKFLVNNGWKHEDNKLPSQLASDKSDLTFYIKRDAKTRCHINFSYDPNDPDVSPEARPTFDLYETCNYYYRSVQDL